jgi:hypothetical protein
MMTDGSWFDFYKKYNLSTEPICWTIDPERLAQKVNQTWITQDIVHIA